MTDILMPALSPTMEEGTLAKWHVKKGDNVRSGDVIAEIETDKATMEVEAADEGVVEEILVAEGSERVKVNTPIARLSGDEASAPPPDPVAAPPPKAKPELAKPNLAHSSTAPKTAHKASDGGRVFASPLARRLAEQKGIDLAAVKGSGPHGRIVLADIKAAWPGRTTAVTSSAAPAAAPRQVLSLEQMGIAPGTYDLIPLDGMRRSVARRMTDSFRDVPHFPLNVDLEIDNLAVARSKINAALEGRGVRVSLNDLIMKAAAVALRRVPEANASYTPEGIAMHHHADIAMAVAVPGGLITPIIRKADVKSIAEIAMEAKDLAARARDKKLRPEEFQGGTFSVSNLSMFGIKNFGSIINEPQGCVLSVSAGEKRPVVHGDRIEIATIMNVTLTCDHRVVDGATGARWLQALKALIEDPIKMLV